jgi:glycine cleavage system transcriptional repressor
MKSQALLTAFGADRVGIVDDLTSLILEAHCNVEESRMSVLGGEFAVILLFSGDQGEVRRLLRELPGRAGALGLQVSLKETAAPQADPQARPYLLATTSLDTPGIVHAVTSALRKHGVNILDLETDTTPAPWTGAPMFHMRARLSGPGRVAVAALREELAELETASNLDIRLTPVSPEPESD